MTKTAGSGSISQRHGSADPDPQQNAMDPQHWLCPLKKKRTAPQLAPFTKVHEKHVCHQCCGPGSICF